MANLWSSAGARLATANFTNETASGWQQVTLSTPVAVTANTVYVASYHAGAGHYSADASYFATNGVDNSPLHFLANGVNGGNGIYIYSSNSAFPTKTYKSTNYWVDVVFQPSTTTASLWPGTTNPGVVDGGPDSSVELGVKFRSDVAGKIIGIRFYKAGTNTGTHVGNLWTSTGTRLGTATFTNETASGWQQVNFTTPVAVAANTVYVASYHTSTGHYSADAGYFATTGVDKSPLHAPVTGTVGGNGVYIYGTSSAFPNQTWNACNYWVDIVFQAGP